MNCLRCRRPFPEADVSRSTEWVEAYDGQGEPIGFICPGCETPEDRKLAAKGEAAFWAIEEEEREAREERESDS